MNRAVSLVHQVSSVTAPGPPFRGATCRAERKLRHATAVIACSLIALHASFAQEWNARASIDPHPRRRAEQATRSLDVLRVGINLVLIPVLVTDLLDRPVAGLTKDSFRIYEDGVEQTVSHFFGDERPISTGILLDTSASMARKIELSKRALCRFVELGVTGDQFSLYKFSDRPEQVLPFTANIKDIEESLPHIQADGRTALFDAIYLSINNMRHSANDRKALLILSDGSDTNSRYTEREIKTIVQEGDVRIFAISILDRSPILERLADESGGRAFRVHRMEDLTAVVAKVSHELHTEYVLGYSPTNQIPNAKYREVKVEAVQPTQGTPFRISWRRGYYGPAE